MEKTIKKEVLYSGKVLDLVIHTVETHNGNISKREIIDHGKAVVILGITKESKLVLAKQYRKAVESMCFELPAGGVEDGESYLNAAIREFKEETGYCLENPMKLTEFYSSPGFTNEKLILFIGDAKNKGETCFDEDEFIITYEFTLEQLKEMVVSGEIEDGKTILGIYMYESLIRSKSWQKNV